MTSVVFPVATQWGTYQHAVGPTLVALVVLAMLGLDAFVAWVGRRRHWSRENAWLAPLAMLVLVLPLAVLFVRLTGAGTEREMARQAVVAGALSGAVPPGDLVITDHPMWVAEATGLRTAALPDEPVAAVTELADRLDAGWLLVLDERGDYPDGAARDPLALLRARLLRRGRRAPLALRSCLPGVPAVPAVRLRVRLRIPAGQRVASAPDDWPWRWRSSPSGSCRCATPSTSTTAGTWPTAAISPTASCSAASTSTPGRRPGRHGSPTSG